MTSTTTRRSNPWMPTIPGLSVSPPKLIEVTTSVVSRLMELNCSTFNRNLDRGLASLQALSGVRDVSTFVARQQKSLQTFWQDQQDAMQAASEVIRSGFEELQAAAATPTSKTVKPVPSRASTRAAATAVPRSVPAQPTSAPAQKARSAATAGAAKTPATDAVFEIYVDKGGEYRFRLKASDGSVLLRSEGYKSRTSAVNGVASVKKNAQNDARYDKQTSTSGKPTFNLKAGNHQVIGSSPTFTSADQMEAAIAMIKQTAGSSKVDDQTQAA